MSNVDSIVQRSSALVAAIDDLLGLDAVDAMVEAAAKLGAGDLIRTGLETLIGEPAGVETVEGERRTVYRGGLLREFVEVSFGGIIDVAALASVLYMLAPLADALGGFVAGTAIELERYQLPVASDAIATGVDYARRATSVVEDFQIEDQTLEQLRAELDRFIAAFEDKHAKLLTTLEGKAA